MNQGRREISGDEVDPEGYPFEVFGEGKVFETGRGKLVSG